MKKYLKDFFRSINNIYGITIFYGIIALFGFYVTCDFTVLFGVISALLANLLIINAIKQNEIQKDNIKFQMFDKRYAVYEAIIESIRVVSKKDYSDYIFSGNVDPFAINKLISDVKSNLNSKTILSQALFRNELFEKVKSIDNEFDKIAALHFTYYKLNIRLKDSDPKRFSLFGDLYLKTILATTTGEIKQCNIELETEFPDIYKTINDFNIAVNAYSNFVKDTGIFSDFSEYIMISDLDK